MRFKVADKLVDGHWEIYCLDDPDFSIKFPDTPKMKAVAHDITAILNDKYFDKEINAEWPKINREERIKFYTDQIVKLKKEDFVVWNEHGTGVE